MTPQQLQEIRERWAGKGPWFSEYGEDQTNREEPPSWNGEMYITGKRGTAQYDQSSYVATVGYNGSGESDAAAIAAAPTDIATLLAEVERLNELQDADRIVTCAYCGFEYGTDTPKSKDTAITYHIKVCEKHPMRAAEKEIERLNRMVDNACDLLTMDSMFSADFWRKNLESEVADK